jgi:protein-tyrosine phosphatase
MVEQHAAGFGVILARLSDPANRPTVYHCTAGKDRAGITTALLLSALGVPRDIILADYTLSNLAYHPIAARVESKMGDLKKLGLEIDTLQPMLIADEQLLAATLEHIEKKYGSIERYLLEKAGVNAEQLEQLRSSLLR